MVKVTSFYISSIVKMSKKNIGCPGRRLNDLFLNKLLRTNQNTKFSLNNVKIVNVAHKLRN